MPPRIDTTIPNQINVFDPKELISIAKQLAETAIHIAGHNTNRELDELHALVHAIAGMLVQLTAHLEILVQLTANLEAGSQ